MKETNIEEVHKFSNTMRDIAKVNNISLWEFKLALVELDIEITKLLMEK